LVITGLAAYNGKYIYGEDGEVAGYPDRELFAGSESGTPVLISNGSVTLNVYITNGSSVVPFTGNGYGGIELFVSDSATSSLETFECIGYVLLTFKNGGGSSQLIPPR